ncbi:hypothetical protein SPB21_33230 [Leptothoe sp. ISB3NOV94-8A]|uniref:hypothetical protein n=1 Tax=Adonisia turfae TaxID=2950184 RepID=UPI0032B4C610
MTGAVSGRVIAVRGSVVDLYFPGTLPALHTQVIIGGSGTVEVVNYLDAHTVRGIALMPTDGFAQRPIDKEPG